MFNDEQFEKLIEELQIIHQILEMQARPQLKEIIEKIASTKERKEMWRMSDGTVDYKYIAKQIGVTVQSVYNFINDGITEQLIEMKKRGYPKRRINFIPSDWPKFKPKKTKEKEEVKETGIEEVVTNEGNIE